MRRRGFKCPHGDHARPRTGSVWQHTPTQQGCASCEPEQHLTTAVGSELPPRCSKDCSASDRSWLLSWRRPLEPGLRCGRVHAADRETRDERPPDPGGTQSGHRLPHRGEVRGGGAPSGATGGVVPVRDAVLQLEGKRVERVLQRAASGSRHDEQQRHQQDTRPAGPHDHSRSVDSSSHAPRPVLPDDQRISPCVTATPGKRHFSTGEVHGHGYTRYPPRRRAPSHNRRNRTWTSRQRWPSARASP